MKTMLVIFFDDKELVPPGQTVSGAYQGDVLERLKKSVRRVWMEIAPTSRLNHENFLLSREFLANDNLATLLQFFYSPDMALTDFLFFPRI